MKHDSPSDLSGKTVIIKNGSFKDSEYVVEDWWDRVMGKSWMVCDGNAACMKYGIRSAMDDLPTDDNVLYGNIGIYGELIHVSEIDQ